MSHWKPSRLQGIPRQLELPIRFPLRHFSEDDIDTRLEKEGLAALEVQASDGWRCYEGGGCWLPVVAKNRAELKRRGVFERALLRAYYAPPRTHYEWDPRWIEDLFLVHANRARLLSEGDPLPRRTEFTVFRGVAGRHVYRREHGLSWTLKRSVAIRFAKRGRYLGLQDPMVLEGRVLRKAVLASLGWRNESEMICREVRIVDRHQLI